MRRDTAQKATAEAARYRRRLRDAETELERRSIVIAGLQRSLVRVWLSGKLADPDDFEQFVRLVDVVRADGRVNWPALQLKVRDLLYRKPHLAAPGFDADELTRVGVGSTSTGTDRGQGPADPVEDLQWRARENGQGRRVEALTESGDPS